MEYTKLGKTGVDVSRICLGCMSFGDPEKWIHKWVLGEEEARKIIQKALDLGINFFDTADVYGLGASETIVGNVLKDCADREEIVLATKVQGQMRNRPNGGGLSRKEIIYEVDESLKRLKTDYIDLLYIHRWDYGTPIEETMCVLNDLVRSGKVHYLGASSMWTYQFQQAQHIAEINGWTKFSVMQGHYNLLYREEEREMNRYCAQTGVALVPYSPLASGRLTRDWESDSLRYQSDAVARNKYDSTMEADRKIVERVGEIAQKYEAGRAQVAMAWLWKKGVCAPIIGVTKEAYLDDFAGALQLKLNDEDVAYLEEQYVPHAVMGHV